MIENRIEELEEARINEAYAKEVERVSGIKPMCEDPEYQSFGKQSVKSDKGQK